MKHTKYRRRMVWQIEDRETCEQAIRQAVPFYFIGAICGIISTAIYVLRDGPEPERGVASILDLWPFAANALILVLALRVRSHKSRIASTLLFGNFAVSFVYIDG